MLLAEDMAFSHDVHVILQDHVGIRERLNSERRGTGVFFHAVRAWSTSASGVGRRVIDAIRFTAWVFLLLLWLRPRVIYVSTDPPVVVPFVVGVYSRLFRVRFIYHLQDIHPEAANVVLDVNPLLFKVMRAVDCYTIRWASRVITLTDSMAIQIKKRSGLIQGVELIENPSVPFDGATSRATKKRGFSFCGNAGRLQRIPLLVEAIKRYVAEGGGLEFTFAGGGIFSSSLQALAENCKNVKYFGQISSREAAELSSSYEWALLPIEDEVTEYAFPSKTSSYVFAGAKILAICGEQTSVANWVKRNEVGAIVLPNIDDMVSCFHRIESGETIGTENHHKRVALMEGLSMPRFVSRLRGEIDKALSADRSF